METYTATVPAESLAEVRERVAKFNRRAAKKGMPVVALVVGPLITREVKDIPLLQVGGIVHEHECSLTVPPLSIGAYVLVARVEPLQRGGKVEPFVTTAPGQTVPTDYTIADTFACEHCGKVRRRAETFLVRNAETGVLVQVGRQCIRDFLGHDPSALLSYWRSLDDGASDEDGGFFGGFRAERQYKADDILRLTARVVAAKGWLSKSNAGPYETPTGTHVHYLLDGPRGNAESKRHWEKFNAECEWTDRAEAIYNQTVSAVQDIVAKEARTGALGDWEWNIMRLATADFVPPHRVGYLASAVVMGWKRVNAPRSEKPAVEPLSRPNVAEGDKVTVTGTVVFTTITEGQWGATTLVKVETSEPRRQYVWWASGALTFEPQQVITLKGTVKRVGYDDYAKGEVATLTRCKVQ